VLRGCSLTRRVAFDDVGEHNRQMWERLAEAGIPYTRPLGKPAATPAASDVSSMS
jgi:hypothetical protein